MLRRIFCCANIIFPKNSGRWKSVAAVSAAFRAGKCGRGVVMYALWPYAWEKTIAEPAMSSSTTESVPAASS